MELVERWYVVRPLEPVDQVEQAARMHFAGLQHKVLADLGLQLQSCVADPGAPHGHVLTELFAYAEEGAEQQRSVVFGVVYALLSLPWDRESVPGYLDYVNLVRALDVSHVTVRALVSAALRFRDLHGAVRDRLLLMLADMVEARWPKVESVLLALQRAASPGDIWPGLASVLSTLCRLVCSAELDDPARTLLWLLRWTAFLEHSLELDGFKVSDLRKQIFEAVVALSRVSLEAGVLHWALSACPRHFELEPLRSSLATIEEADMSQEHLEHMLTPAEKEQILCILQATPAQEERMVKWFFQRNIDCRQGQDVHLADVILFAVSAAAPENLSRQRLWRQLWRRASGHSQATLAFCYLSRRPGYGRRAFAQALGGQGSETPEELLGLADVRLHAMLKRCLDVWGR